MNPFGGRKTVAERVGECELTYNFVEVIDHAITVKIKIHNIPSNYTVSYSVIENQCSSFDTSSWEMIHYGEVVDTIEWGKWLDSNTTEIILKGENLDNANLPSFSRHFSMKIYIIEFPMVEGIISYGG